METRKTIVWDRRAIVAVVLLFIAVLLLVWTSVFKCQWRWSTGNATNWTASIDRGTFRLTWFEWPPRHIGSIVVGRPDPSRWQPVYHQDSGPLPCGGYCDIPPTTPLGILASGSFWYLWRKRKYPAHYCQKCGYNLTGNTSGICPECGTSITVSEKKSNQQPDAYR